MNDMPKKQPPTPRPATTVLLLRPSKAGDAASPLEVFMVVRHHQIDAFSGALVFPGGKLEFAEPPEAGLAREVKEELGIEIEVGDPFHVVNVSRTPETAVLVGHDWGAPVAWHAALLRPDRVRGVVGLSVPYRPRGTAPPTSVMPQTDDAMFYQLYFQTPGVAEAELERDVRGTLRWLLYSFSGEGFPSVSARSPFGGAMVAKKGGVLDGTVTPEAHDPRMVSGMTARIEIVTEQLKNALHVPIESVMLLVSTRR